MNTIEVMSLVIVVLPNTFPHTQDWTYEVTDRDLNTPLTPMEQL
jgi:hypothetical protein